MLKTEQPNGIVNCPKMLKGLGAANFHISLQTRLRVYFLKTEYVEYAIWSAFPKYPSGQAFLFA